MSEVKFPLALAAMSVIMSIVWAIMFTTGDDDLFWTWAILSPVFLICLGHNFSLKEGIVSKSIPFTISYALARTGIEEKIILDHIYNPLIFLLKQFLILLPIALIFYSLINTKKISFNFEKKKNIFILIINFVPLVLMLLTSFVFGAKIRTMWMTPFYLFFGVFLVQLLIKNIKKENFKKFLFTSIIFFLMSPISYAYVSIKNEFKRTDYPGKEIANLVQRRWDRNFSNEISIVVGDEWYAGNLSYHLRTRPTWYNTIENNLSIINSSTGVVYTGNPDILKEFCPGVYGTIKPIGICMIGKK